MPTDQISDIELVNAGLSHPVFKASPLVVNLAQPEALAAVVASPRTKLTISPGLLAQLGNLSKQTPAQQAASMIEAKYTLLGGVKSWLKAANTPVTVCPDKIGYFRHYAGGSIYFHPSTGAHAVKGAIRSLWASLGWERGSLAYPTTDEEVGRDKEGRGRYTRFQGGAIYWTPEFGAIKLEGPILDKYLDTGAEMGPLGYPKQEQRETPGKDGRYVHFEHGSIYDSNAAGAWEVHGLIRAYWASQGWERNPNLGYPISDERIPRHTKGSVISANAVIVKNRLDDVIVAKPVGVTGIMAAEAAKPLVKAKANPVTLDPKVLKLLSQHAGIAAKSVLVTARPFQGSDYEDSSNRFSDFENGVVFWKRGAPAAVALSPWLKTSAGQSMRVTTSSLGVTLKEIVEKALKGPTLALRSTRFVGATDYQHDESGVTNRRQRYEFTFRGEERVGNAWQARDVTLRINALVAWDEIKRRVDVSIVSHGWTQFTRSLKGIEDLGVYANQRLHPLYWVPHMLFTIPSQDRNRDVSVLSVKTMESGQVNVYIEPNA